MKRFTVCLLLGLATSLPIVGCAEKTQVQETKEVTTPGGTTTEETTKSVEKTGDHKEGDAAAPAPEAPAKP
jgi:hypothetical protein